MSETPQHHLDPSLKEKALAIWRLPTCAFKEVISRIGLLDDNETKDYKAQHEAGHTLINLLEGRAMTRAEISRLRDSTCNQLNTLLGGSFQFRFEMGVVSTNDDDDREFEEQHPDRNAIQALAGIAANQDPKHGHFFEQLLDKELAKGVDEPWEDISVPYRYIQDRFVAIHQRTPSQQEVSNIFRELLNEIRTIFSERKFAAILTQIKELIKSHKLKKNVNDTILKTLFANGFTQEDLTEMQQRIASIDIDKVIQKHNRPTA
jgi:hypothetical protein